MPRRQGGFAHYPRSDEMPSECFWWVIVQHTPEGLSVAFAAGLNTICKIRVKEAAQGNLIVQGLAAIAPRDQHLLVRHGTYYYTKVIDSPLVSGHKFSVDVLFRSVLQVVGPEPRRVIVTGMVPKDSYKWKTLGRSDCSGSGELRVRLVERGH